MASVVFLRAVNVGGANLCRPAQLASELKKLGVINVGSVGTFVVRENVTEARLRDAIARRLPFTCEIMICPGSEILKLSDGNYFVGAPAGAEFRRFLTVLEKRPPASRSRPFSIPSADDWQLKVLGIHGRFVIGIYRRDMRAISHLGKLEKIFGVPATTRSWSTVDKVVQVLRRIGKPAQLS